MTNTLRVLIVGLLGFSHALAIASEGPRFDQKGNCIWPANEWGEEMDHVGPVVEEINDSKDEKQRQKNKAASRLKIQKLLKDQSIERWGRSVEPEVLYEFTSVRGRVCGWGIVGMDKSAHPAAQKSKKLEALAKKSAEKINGKQAIVRGISADGCPVDEGWVQNFKAQYEDELRQHHGVKILSKPTADKREVDIRLVATRDHEGTRVSATVDNKGGISESFTPQELGPDSSSQRIRKRCGGELDSRLRGDHRVGPGGLKVAIELPGDRFCLGKRISPKITTTPPGGWAHLWRLSSDGEAVYLNQKTDRVFSRSLTPTVVSGSESEWLIAFAFTGEPRDHKTGILSGHEGDCLLGPGKNLMDLYPSAAFKKVQFFVEACDAEAVPVDARPPREKCSLNEY